MRFCTNMYKYVCVCLRICVSAIHCQQTNTKAIDECAADTQALTSNDRSHIRSICSSVRPSTAQSLNQVFGERDRSVMAKVTASRDLSRFCQWTTHAQELVWQLCLRCRHLRGQHVGHLIFRMPILLIFCLFSALVYTRTHTNICAYMNTYFNCAEPIRQFHWFSRNSQNKLATFTESDFYVHLCDLWQLIYHFLKSVGFYCVCATVRLQHTLCHKLKCSCLSTIKRSLVGSSSGNNNHIGTKYNRI